MLLRYTLQSVTSLVDAQGAYVALRGADPDSLRVAATVGQCVELDGAQIMINAGNQAFHAGDYRLAARRYAAAAVIRRDDPVAYFGLGMALTRLGRDEDARAAYARARELAQQQREQRH